MRKYLFLALLSGIAFPLFQPCVSAQTDATADDALQTVSKSALAAKRAGTKLNETLLHKTVLDYSLPVDISAVSKKCAAGETDACYFSFKTFENSTDTSVAAAANLELAVLSQQRGLIKQALSYIDRAAELKPDDAFIQLTKGWLLLSAGKYKKSRQAFSDLLYLTADFEYVSSAKLGTALAWYLGGEK